MGDVLVPSSTAESWVDGEAEASVRGLGLEEVFEGRTDRGEIVRREEDGIRGDPLSMFAVLGDSAEFAEAWGGVPEGGEETDNFVRFGVGMGKGGLLGMDHRKPFTELVGRNDVFFFFIFLCPPLVNGKTSSFHAAWPRSAA